MKNLLLLACFSLVAFTGAAQDLKPFTGYPNAVWPSKATPKPEDFRLSHDDFVTTYGVNDTAAAIIHMYLSRHFIGRRTGQAAALVTSIAGGIASGQADAEAVSQGQVADPTNRKYPGWFYPVLTVGSGTMLT